MMHRLFILLCVMAVGCATPPPASRHSTRLARAAHDAPETEWIRTELFFGLSKPDGSLLSTDEWNTFLDERVLRRFPDGFTVLDSTGRYLDHQRRTIKEPSKVVILFYTNDHASTANGNITAIVEEYCSQFDQESVLRSDSIQKTSFLSSKTARNAK